MIEMKYNMSDVRSYEKVASASDCVDKKATDGQLLELLEIYSLHNAEHHSYNLTNQHFYFQEIFSILRSL